jgi:hypothetical protein
MTPNEILLILKFLTAVMPPPDAQSDGAHKPAVLQDHRSLGDTAESVLRCYHPTGRVQAVDVLEAPWKRQNEWNGTSSAVLRIRWRGTLYQYTSVVALVASQGAVHGVLLADGARIPASKQCALDGWVKVN